MGIQLYDTLTAKKQPLIPLKEGEITMYCCGVTPYSNMHIGHCRTFFSYDLLYRTLVDYGYKVTWARNITDVDDKIIQKANTEGVSCAHLVELYVTEQNQALTTFCLHRPEHEPKVTEHIQQIINLIQKLIDAQFAYVTLSGVYYRVRKFTAYGKLSKNKIDDLKKGARIEIDEHKEDALDFALWKFAKPNEISWISTWGEGRPGWHVECSAMIHALFGNSIDIHMGGRDLIFPHHEAEIAQSEAATGTSLANIWLHTGMVTLYSEKMSKSTNHYVSTQNFLEKYPHEVLRLVFLSTSYSQPLDFTFELATENLKKLSKFYRFVALIDSYSENVNTQITAKQISPELLSQPLNQDAAHHNDLIFSHLPELISKMKSYLFDDLNSVSALAEFFEFIRSVNNGINKLEKLNAEMHLEDKKIIYRHWNPFKLWLQTTFGLLTKSPAEFFASLSNYHIGSEISVEQINAKINERDAARLKKDWAISDQIRKELQSQGIQIQDTPRGTKWTLIIE